MKNIPLPNKVYFQKDEDNEVVLVMEPLYPGYGVTIGNALRRVLLSSLPGAALTAVKIKGVDHEFSTIDGLREDIVDLVLNLKQVRLKVFSDQPVKLRLKATGPKEVKVGDIEQNSDVETINNDFVIATLDEGTTLDMELTAEKGRGYIPVEMQEGEKTEIGVIAIDAIYTPIKNVNYEVENVRVGDITNFDKLTLKMRTDGTITGKEAFDLASQILVDHFSLMLTSTLSAEEDIKLPEVSRQPEGEEQELMPDAVIENVQEDVAEEASDLLNLNLSNRSLNALEKNGIRNVEQLTKMTSEELENLEGLGKKSINEILEALGRSNEAS